MKLTVIVFFLTGIKKYIVNVIIKLSSTPESLDREKVYLNKLNMILVQVSVDLILVSPEYIQKLLSIFIHKKVQKCPLDTDSS